MEFLRFQRHLSGTTLAILSDISKREKDEAGMNNSSDEKIGETMSPSGSAKRLEEVLDNLNLETLSAPLLRTLLSQTMETLKVARRRVDEQENKIEILTRLSTTDPATSLLNMRGIHLTLRKLLARAKRDETGGALLVIDLDGFKLINKTFGHAAGNDVLVGVARYLMDAVREGDEIARLGGDEFAIIMPGVTPFEADKRAMAINAGLNQLIIPWQERTIHVRGSVGGACFGPEDDMKSVYRRADEDMYRRKSERTALQTTGAKNDA